MLTNVFPDGKAAPEYNAVDASLWFVIAVHDLARTAEAAGASVPLEVQRELEGTVEAILEAYARGTRFGIRAEADGLLAAGTPGVQLTWMDAKAGDRVVSPRIGEPGYAPRYEGGEIERARAYHQGTAWPWLLGAFVEGWVRVRGGGAGTKQEARARFLEPVLSRLDAWGLGHLPEIADAEPPHT